MDARTNPGVHKRAKRLLAAAKEYAYYVGYEIDTGGAATIDIPVVPTQYNATRVLKVSTKLITTLPKDK